MRAADVMTERVLRVRPETSVLDIATTLSERQISALPVVDTDGRLVGIVTEGDLMRRPEIGTERRQGLAQTDSLLARRARAAAYVKSHGVTAADVMTRDVVTMTQDTPLTAIAELMENRRIRRVPVVEDGKLVGIVSRLDLVRALPIQDLRGSQKPLGDADIQAQLSAEIADQGWRLGPASKIVVFEGVVHLFGSITSAPERRALVTAATLIPGVRSVQDHLQIKEPRVEYP
jgi:CBS domain-containing protein